MNTVNWYQKYHLQHVDHFLSLPAISDLSDTPKARTERRYDFTYVQGMNVLAAPFLYTMPSELEAFYCFTRFIEFHCPLYVQPTLEGVHSALQVSLPRFHQPIFISLFAPSGRLIADRTGCFLCLSQLLDKCLEIVDPELFKYLRSKNLRAEIYAFPCPLMPSLLDRPSSFFFFFFRQTNHSALP